MTRESLVLKTTAANGVITLQLNRPHVRNALNQELIATLQTYIAACAADSTVRVIIITATGTHFCAGADLHWLQTQGRPENARAEALQLAHLLETIDRCPKPTLAVVQGPVYGGGVGLVSVCDIVIAAETAFFCLSEVRLGLVPGVISPYVIKAIGERQMRRYALTAEPLSAAQALQWGLVHRVEAELSESVDATVAEILKGGPEALQATKALIRDLAFYPEGITRQQELAGRITEARHSAEGQEGMAAFFAKRPAAWVPGQGS
jgi:methylglutaconyl-CoA hydratase